MIEEKTKQKKNKTYFGHCITNRHCIIEESRLLLLTELLVIVVVVVVVISVPVFEDIIVFIVFLGVVIMIKGVKDQHIILIDIDVDFAHTCIEQLNEGLAGELDGMGKTTNAVGFVKQIFESIKGTCLDII